MIEREIGETIRTKTIIVENNEEISNEYFKAVEITGDLAEGCYQCAFYNYFCYGIACKAEERKDGKNVRFVEVDES